MAKGKPPALPFTPKAAAPVAPAPADAPPATCSGCKHWGRPAAARAAPAGTGECRAAPPTVQVSLGPVLGYPLTAGDLPACGVYAPRA